MTAMNMTSKKVFSLHPNGDGSWNVCLSKAALDAVHEHMGHALLGVVLLTKTVNCRNPGELNHLLSVLHEVGVGMLP